MHILVNVLFIYVYYYYLEEIIPNEKKTSILSSVDSYGTLKGLEHSVNPQLLKYARETESLNAHSRQKYRRRLFAVYPNLHQVYGFVVP